MGLGLGTRVRDHGERLGLETAPTQMIPLFIFLFYAVFEHILSVVILNLSYFLPRCSPANKTITVETKIISFITGYYNEK